MFCGQNCMQWSCCMPGRVAGLGIELTISPGWDSRLGIMTGAICGAIRWGQIEIEVTRLRESRSARLIDWYQPTYYISCKIWSLLCSILPFQYLENLLLKGSFSSMGQKVWSYYMGLRASPLLDHHQFIIIITKAIDFLALSGAQVVTMSVCTKWLSLS